MQNILENLTIGTFAKAAGVNVETIRFYQRKGLLSEPDKLYGSIRRYGEADVTRVRFVKSAQRLGFSLDEIAELLRLDDGTHCDEASHLAEHKLLDVREKMALLGLDLAPGTPEALASLIQLETAKWANVVKESGAKPD